MAAPMTPATIASPGRASWPRAGPPPARPAGASPSGPGRRTCRRSPGGTASANSDGHGSARWPPSTMSADDDRPQHVRREHDPAPVVAVGPGAREQPDGHRRQRDEDRHQGDGRGRAREVEHEQEQREVGHAVADVGDRLGEVEAPEVGDAEEVADAVGAAAGWSVVGSLLGQPSVGSVGRGVGARPGAAWGRPRRRRLGLAVRVASSLPNSSSRALSRRAQLGGPGRRQADEARATAPRAAPRAPRRRCR